MDAQQLRRIRETPLESVLEAFGAVRDPKHPKRNWKVAGHRITVTGNLFFDHDEGKGGGGAIDIALHLLGHDPKETSREAFRSALQQLGGVDAKPVRTFSSPPNSADSSRPRGDASEPPIPTPSRLPVVRANLVNHRGIPEALVEDAISKGLVFADRHGNAVFRLVDADGRQVGFEKRGTADQPYHRVHGTKGVFAVGSQRAATAAFVESGIEALSYKAMHSNVLVISTTGDAVTLPHAVASALLARGVRVLAAFNADAAGDRMATRFIERLGGAPVRVRPDARIGKDWNLQLQAQRATAAQQAIPTR